MTTVKTTTTTLDLLRNHFFNDYGDDVHLCTRYRPGRQALSELGFVVLRQLELDGLIRVLGSVSYEDGDRGVEEFDVLDLDEVIDEPDEDWRCNYRVQLTKSGRVFLRHPDRVEVSKELQNLLGLGAAEKNLQAPQASPDEPVAAPSGELDDQGGAGTGGGDEQPEPTSSEKIDAVINKPGQITQQTRDLSNTIKNLGHAIPISNKEALEFLRGQRNAWYEKHWKTGKLKRVRIVKDRCEVYGYTEGLVDTKANGGVHWDLRSLLTDADNPPSINPEYLDEITGICTRSEGYSHK